MEIVLFISVLFVCLTKSCAHDKSPTVTSESGTYVGLSDTVTVKNKHVVINKFLGVPYANPPVGSLRFKKTELVIKHEEPYIANKVGPACRQILIPNMFSSASQSEDCLYLNIYVPVQHADQDTGHAVMVFIHGGAFIVGTGANYRGDKLAAHGNVIVVTINYRLGILGFFGTGEEDAPGNLGFWDQRLALQWINKNIASFGGDKDRVTLFGESAGGTAVVFHALYPENEGLFRRIISQSGAPLASAGLITYPQTVLSFVSDQLDCSSDSNEDVIRCLQDKDIEQIMNSLNELMKDQSNIAKLRFYPLIDDDFVKVHPGSLRRMAEISEPEQVRFFRKIDTMIGVNSQEGAMFVAVPFTVPVEDPETFAPTRDDFETQILPAVIAFEFGTNAPEVLKQLLTSMYTNWSDPDSQSSVRQQFLDVWGDVIFNVAAIETSELHANSSASANTFLYLLEATPTTPILRKMSWVKGANHADELQYIFGFDTDIMATNQIFEEPFPWEYELSYNMMSYWSNFAKYGNPNSRFEAQVSDLPTWPSYDVTKKEHINLEKDITIGTRLFAERVNFWSNVIPDVMEALNQQKKLSGEKHGFCEAGGNCGCV